MAARTQEERLRTSPDDRFAGDEHLIDTDAVAQQLHAEHEAKRGHRQMVVFKGENVTISVFDFEKDGELPEHKAGGVVTAQCLHGRISFETPSGTHDLTPGMVFVMRPDVAHRVRAQESSRMLVTVCLKK